MSGEQHGRRPRRLPVDVGSPLLFVVAVATAAAVIGYAIVWHAPI